MKLSFSGLLSLLLATGLLAVGVARGEEVPKGDLEIYEKALYVGDARVRAAAVEALVKNHPRAFELLVPYLEKNIDKPEAAAAVKAMASLHLGAETLPTLERLYRLASEAPSKQNDRAALQYGLSKLMYNLSPARYVQQFYNVMLRYSENGLRYGSTFPLDVKSMATLMPKEKFHALVPALLARMADRTTIGQREEYVDLLIFITGRNFFSSGGKAGAFGPDFNEGLETYRRFYYQKMVPELEPNKAGAVGE